MTSSMPRTPPTTSMRSSKRNRADEERDPAIGALLDTLTRLEGRVALVYVGAGFNALPGSDLTEAWQARFGEFLGATYEPRPEWHRSHQARDRPSLQQPQRLRVTVYSIHGGERGAANGDRRRPGRSGTTTA